MASSEASIDSRYVTGRHLDIAPWIHPTIQGLCKEMGAPAAAPHILAGVTTILTLPSQKKEDKKDKIPALIAAVYLFVSTRLSGHETSGQEYVSQRKGVLSTFTKLREDQGLGEKIYGKAKEGTEWEGWEKVRPKDVDAWLLEISNRGWVKLDWFQNIVGVDQLEASNTQQPKLNSCLKRKPDADAAESSSCQKKRKVDDDDVHEQEFYKIENSGERDLRAIPIAGGKPWNSLPSKESATLDDWKFNIGDPVYVRRTGNHDGLAKVSDIRHLGPECYLVELAWYYTRDEIKEEIPKQRQAHLDAKWPPDASFSHMLSSNRTINVFNTLRGKASAEVIAKLCPDKFYVTTNSIRKIYKAGNPNYKWMKELLHLEARAVKGGGLKEYSIAKSKVASKVVNSKAKKVTPPSSDEESESAVEDYSEEESDEECDEDSDYSDEGTPATKNVVKKTMKAAAVNEAIETSDKNTTISSVDTKAQLLDRSKILRPRTLLPRDPELLEMQRSGAFVMVSLDTIIKSRDRRREEESKADRSDTQPKLKSPPDADAAESLTKQKKRKVVPDADAMLIQPSITSTPQNELPLGEQTLANVGGELPTATLDQTTIESSITPIVAESALLDIQPSTLPQNPTCASSQPIPPQGEETLAAYNIELSDDFPFFGEPWNIPTSDDWPVLDDFSSATTELPYMSEETPADGESTFDQTTIDSSSITSPIVTVAPHDIEYMNWNIWYESDRYADPTMLEYTDLGGSTSIFMKDCLNFDRYSFE